MSESGSDLSSDNDRRGDGPRPAKKRKRDAVPEVRHFHKFSYIFSVQKSLMDAPLCAARVPGNTFDRTPTDPHRCAVLQKAALLACRCRNFFLRVSLLKQKSFWWNAISTVFSTNLQHGRLGAALVVKRRLFVRFRAFFVLLARVLPTPRSHRAKVVQFYSLACALNVRGSRAVSQLGRFRRRVQASLRPFFSFFPALCARSIRSFFH